MNDDSVTYPGLLPQSYGSWATWITIGREDYGDEEDHPVRRDVAPGHGTTTTPLPDQEDTMPISPAIHAAVDQLAAGTQAIRKA